jgi:predicted nucleotidyltransferase
MQKKMMEEIVQGLANIKGIDAIVLGGSRARGTHNNLSDIDLGIYYSSETDLNIEALGRFCKEIDDENREDLITGIGGWGPWINGGGWLKVQSIPVDILYRDMNKVKLVMNDCLDGNISIDYQPGHPHGFINHMYMAEVALCRPLWDPKEIFVSLISQTVPYSSVLKRAIITKFLWEAHFSLEAAYKSIARQDVSYAAGCCFRAVSCLSQTLFALNEQYWMNEKGSVELIQSFSIRPRDYKTRINEVFSRMSYDKEDLTYSIKQLDQIANEVDALSGTY